MILVIVILTILLEITLRLFIDNPPTTYKYNPYYVWEYRPNAKSTLLFNGTRLEVSMNEEGFHDTEVPETKTKKRILALGDSIIAATSLPIEQGTISKLRLQLNSYDIINTGVSGWNTEQELLFLLTKGLDYEPDIVLLYFYIGNDITTNYFRNYTTIADGNLTLNPRSLKDSGVVRKTYYFLDRYSILFRLARAAILRPVGSKQPSEPILCDNIGVEPTYRLIENIFEVDQREIDNDVWQKNYLLLGYMNAILKKKNIDFIVILVPDMIQVDPAAQKIVMNCFNLTAEDLDWQRPNKKLVSFLINNNIPYIDTYDGLKNGFENNQIYLPSDIHFNEVGHQILADIVAIEFKKATS